MTQVFFSLQAREASNDRTEDAARKRTVSGVRQYLFHFYISLLSKLCGHCGKWIPERLRVERKKILAGVMRGRIMFSRLVGVFFA